MKALLGVLGFCLILRGLCLLFDNSRSLMIANFNSGKITLTISTPEIIEIPEVSLIGKSVTSTTGLKSNWASLLPSVSIDFSFSDRRITSYPSLTKPWRACRGSVLDLSGVRAVMSGSVSSAEDELTSTTLAFSLVKTSSKAR